MKNKTGEKYLSIKRNWCKRCGYCVEFCPKNVFDIGEDGYPVVARLEDCNECRICVYICPDLAVIAEPEVEEKIKDR
ncbi:MAG: 2-ketoglutarate ferredoxin oxidoreductase subunit delta [Spirochaetes bacterium]|nr:MAG: 2-ketoglutarate ferredoxin oxidoreductase subunit delta [Spirochaetota bacterium]